MLNVKFNKTGSAIYISHIDMQKAINRTFKRAGIEPDYSLGFNPHTLLKMSQPIPLGIASYAEYFTLSASGVTKEEFMERTAETSPIGINFMRVWETTVSPNFAGKIQACDYFISSDAIKSIRGKLFLESKESFIIYQKTEKGRQEKEVKDLILGMRFEDDGLYVRLATGAATLRADRFVETLNAKYGLSIPLQAVSKVDALFVSADGQYVSADDFLCEMETKNEVH